MRCRTATALTQFDRWSRSYDRSILQRLLFRPSHHLLLKHLTGDDRRVLDIGCGTGVFAERVLQQFPDAWVWGLDLSSQMLQHGQARDGRHRERFFSVRGDSERLPFRDGFFDVVTCSHSFHHYSQQEQVVEEMFRVLRPDGRLLIVDGDRDGFWGWLVYDVVVTLMEGDVHHCSARRFRRLFRDAGFEEVRQVYQDGLAPFVLTLGRASKPAVLPLVPLTKTA